MTHPSEWLCVRAEGLYCAPGDFFIDPVRPVGRAVITHAHSDHARAGHGAVLATAETLALMQTRMGEALQGTALQALAPRESVTLNGATVRLHPAGHVLGSAQVSIEACGGRAVVSGDYKRAADPTCAPFEPVECDVFITEATFGLPVFTHPPAGQEAAKLLESLKMFPERAHLVGCYALGKTQRLIAVLRELGYDDPIYLHGALIPVCETYERLGVRLGALRPATAISKAGAAQAEMAGRIVLAPPSALADRWSRRLPDPVTALASGWMRVRQRAKARLVELPLVISDHADWPELLATFDDVGAPEVWVTHGEETALIHAAEQRGLVGRALRLIGYGDAAEEEAA
jgi:putative mRNA 3-end processing factor